MAEPDSTRGGVTHHLMSLSIACSRLEVAQTFRNNNNLSFLPFFLFSFLALLSQSIHPILEEPHLLLPEGLWRPPQWQLVSAILLVPGVNQLFEHLYKRTFVILPQHQHSFCHLNPDLIPCPKLVFSCLSAHFNISHSMEHIFMNPILFT